MNKNNAQKRPDSFATTEPVVIDYVREGAPHQIFHLANGETLGHRQGQGDQEHLLAHPEALKNHPQPTRSHTHLQRKRARIEAHRKRRMRSSSDRPLPIVLACFLQLVKGLFMVWIGVSLISQAQSLVSSQASIESARDSFIEATGRANSNEELFHSLASYEETLASKITETRIKALAEIVIGGLGIYLSFALYSLRKAAALATVLLVVASFSGLVEITIFTSFVGVFVLLAVLSHLRVFR